MNNKRRAALRKIRGTLLETKEELCSVKDDEYDAYNNVPESIKDSDKGIRLEENIDDLKEAIWHVQASISYIAEALK